MTNEAAVSQAEANYYSIETSLFDLEYQIREMENSLSSLLGEAPRSFERGTLDEQILPENLVVGIPAQMLSNRPDVKKCRILAGTGLLQHGRSPVGVLSGPQSERYAGLDQRRRCYDARPRQMDFQCCGIARTAHLHAGRNQAQLRIAKAQQQEALLSFQQTLLNAGAEVNNALAKCQSARSKVDLRQKQVASLETAVESTQLLMRHGSTTYLEVLTAQQTLLSAQLSQINDRFSEIQAIVDLYHALGGGRDLEPETEQIAMKRRVTREDIIRTTQTSSSDAFVPSGWMRSRKSWRFPSGHLRVVQR